MREIIIRSFRIIVLVAVLVGSALVARGQDVISTVSGQVIRAKVLEVSPSIVKYKRESNPDGPTYTVYTSDLIKILYENGEVDIFNEALAEREAGGSPYAPEMLPGLKYKNYKALYNPRMYIPQLGDPYSPGWSGIASAIIPGFGQALSDEWGRGTCFFLGSLALSCASLASLEWNTYGLEYSYSVDVEGNSASGILALASLGLYIWNICDAVRVAKVKNMYYQDMRSRRTGGLDVRLEPFVAAAPATGLQGRPAAAGLSLRVAF